MSGSKISKGWNHGNIEVALGMADGAAFIFFVLIDAKEKRLLGIRPASIRDVHHVPYGRDGERWCRGSGRLLRRSTFLPLEPNMSRRADYQSDGRRLKPRKKDQISRTVTSLGLCRKFLSGMWVSLGPALFRWCSVGAAAPSGSISTLQAGTQK